MFTSSGSTNDDDEVLQSLPSSSSWDICWDSPRPDSSTSRECSSSNSCTRRLKIVVTGSFGIGKSCLVSRLLDPSDSSDFDGTSESSQKYENDLAVCHAEFSIPVDVTDGAEGEGRRRRSNVEFSVPRGRTLQMREAGEAGEAGAVDEVMRQESSENGESGRWKMDLLLREARMAPEWEELDSMDATYRRAVLRTCDCVILGFDVTLRKSFEDAIRIIVERDFAAASREEEEESTTRATKIAFVVVGLKRDLRNVWKEGGYAGISEREALQQAKEIGALGYFECSAKTGWGVLELRNELCQIRLGLLEEIERQLPGRKKGLGGILRGLFRREESIQSRLFREFVAESFAWSLRFWNEIRACDRDLARRRMLPDPTVAEFVQEYVVDGSNTDRRLSLGPIIHLIREFVLIDLHRDVPAFFVELIRHLDEYSLSREPDEVRKLWFGVSGAPPTRSLFQVFANFRIRNSEDFKFLPKRLRYVEMSDGHNSVLPQFFRRTVEVFESDLTLVDDVRVVYPEFLYRYVSRCGGMRSASIQFSHDTTVGGRWDEVTAVVNERFARAQLLCLEDLIPSTGHISRYYGRNTFGGEFVLPQLRSLVLVGDCVDQKAVDFRNDCFQLLTTLKLVGDDTKNCFHPYNDYKSLMQSSIQSLALLPHLRSLLFRNLDLWSSRDVLPDLFLSSSIQNLFFYCVRFPYDSMADWHVGNSSCLRSIVVVCPGKFHACQESFPADFISDLKSLALTSNIRHPVICHDRWKPTHGWFWAHEWTFLQADEVSRNVDEMIGFVYLLKAAEGDWISNLSQDEVGLFLDRCICPRNEMNWRDRVN